MTTPANKPHPLRGQIECVTEFEGVSTIWYMVRGHVSKEEFAREMSYEFDLTVPLTLIKHAYARLVPLNRYAPNPGMMTINLSKKGRGAFSITYVEAYRL